ncbi:MAG: hypothetical protein U1A27_04205 [Phycisphaerae bacterium]
MPAELPAEVRAAIADVAARVAGDDYRTRVVVHSTPAGAELITAVPNRSLWTPVAYCIANFLVLMLTLATSAAIAAFVAESAGCESQRSAKWGQLAADIVATVWGIRWLFLLARGVWRVARTTRLANRLIGDPTVQTPELIGRLIEPIGFFESAIGPRRLLRLLQRSGRVGTTIRLDRIGRSDRRVEFRTPFESAERAAAPIEPIAVPFEPLPCDQFDVRWDSLLDANRTLDATDQVRHDQARKRHRREIRVQIAARAVPALALAFFIYLPFAADLSASTSVGTSLALALAVATVWLYARWYSADKRHWLLVPGGLIHRRRQVELFARQAAVLCVAKLRGGDRWLVRVADAFRTRRFFVTHDECNLLLRAWLSPLAPPRKEQLTDFN